MSRRAASNNSQSSSGSSAGAAPPPRIRVTEIGEFVRHNSCERRFKLGFNNGTLAKQLPFSNRLFNVLDVVLSDVGKKREKEWESTLVEAGLTKLPANSTDEGVEWTDFVAALPSVQVGKSYFCRELRVSGILGNFIVEGRIDFVLILWRGDAPYLRIVECKASRRDRTYHRLQVTTYKLLLERLIAADGLTICGKQINHIECAVARIDESTNEGQAILTIPPLDADTLEVLTDDLLRLLGKVGPLTRIINSQLDDLPYVLEPKCDGCAYNVHCFPESSRQRKIELLGVNPSTLRVLRSCGIPNIDALADIDLSGTEAAQIRQSTSFSGNLEQLKEKAIARRKTLPGGGAHPDEFPVAQLPERIRSQLPEHSINGRRLLRVYLAVDYDYTENRIGALSAHVTQSEGLLHCSFSERDGRWQPDPNVKELLRPDLNGQEVEQPLSGEDIIRFKTSPWSGNLREDNATEKQLIEDFFHQLVEAIARISAAPEVPIHFYVWSRSEMGRLVEGCSRGGSHLLASLRELMGCRESLEQLIYSCLQTEIDNRYALGLTGRGLVVVTSLTWYGKRYHWKRRIGGIDVDLDREFTQDLFDFKTDLEIKSDGEWASNEGEGTKHKIEIRSRFFDSLPAPYWHAFWRTLPDPSSPDLKPDVKSAIRRYNVAARPLLLNEYLKARVHALRWIEERVRFKNTEIDKPLVNIGSLPDFRLATDSIAMAAVDFLRLEQHMKLVDWVGDHLVPPEVRVLSGRTLPLTNVRTESNAKLLADIDTTQLPITIEDLESRCSLSAGDIIRIAPAFDSLDHGQTLGQLFRNGSTCVIEELDWENAEIRCAILPQIQPDRYRVRSIPRDADTLVFDYATLDESPSDYVAPRVDARLNGNRNNNIFQWFDRVNPTIPPKSPLTEKQKDLVNEVLASFRFENQPLASDQTQAILDGLDTRVQLLQGPPGTGKTLTTSVALGIRTLLRCRPGDVIIVASSTHRAVDNLLNRFVAVLPSLQAACGSRARLPAFQLAKLHSSQINDPLRAPIANWISDRCVRDINRARGNAVVVLGGTTGTVLKAFERFRASSTAANITPSILIIDEASMMVFPHFLSTATLLNEDGEIMLAGDHRQLAPILSHDWEREDRPPSVLYQPFVSAYEAARELASQPGVDPASIRRSALTYSYRLPFVIRSLISRLYRRDEIELGGPSHQSGKEERAQDGQPFSNVWLPPTGLFLVVHSERQSAQSNEFEAKLIERIFDEGGSTQEARSVAIITPHRAQRTLLRKRLERYEEIIDVIDTVERLQGGEKPTVIFSATASDPATISKSVEFILDLNRSNVAFSRAQSRLIVVCSSSLLNHVPGELDQYDSALLWKSLRTLCTRSLVTLTIDGSSVEILTVDVAKLSEQRPQTNPSTD